MRGPGGPPMLKIAFDKFVLKNGLTVILHVDRSSPLVAVDLWYHVGSKDESPGRTGFAHLFEHLMFMGSRNAPYPAFDSIMESWRGYNNGTTSNDRTNYYETGPRNLLETFLWLEADRLATLPDVITDEELDRQRKVVQNERRQSYENRPYARGELEIPAAMYPPTHPYHWPTIGSHEDLEAATVADVRAFFERFYRPSNASLVVAGDFYRDQARRLIDRHFGWQPAREAPAHPPTPAIPPLAADIKKTLTDRVQLPRLRLVWHAPALFQPGDADLDSAAHVLAGAKVQPTLQVAGLRTPHRPGRVRVSELAAIRQPVSRRRHRQARPRPRRSGRGRRQSRLPASPTTARRKRSWTRARNTHLADFYKSLDHLQTRADLLNHYEHALGDPGGVERDRRALPTGDGDVGTRRLRARDVGPTPGPANVPRDGGDLVIETPAVMATAPAVGPLPKVALPQTGGFSLANGLEVVTVRRDVAPIVAASLMFRSGGGEDPPGKAGLASITAEMLDEGAGTRDALALADELELLGSDLLAGERPRRLAAFCPGPARDVRSRLADRG